MKRKILVFVYALLLVSLTVFTAGTVRAQDASQASLQETGRVFMRQGDYNNALLVFNRLLLQKPNDLSVLKDIAYTHFLKRDFVKALEVARPLSEREDADVQTYQIAGLVFRNLEELRECEKMYRRALKKYPASGVLHSELGELLWSQNNAEAIRLWEAGIEADPSFAGNYYHATRYYYLTTDRIWSLIYGEMFLNMESFSARSAEIKYLLPEAYKKFFSADPKLKSDKRKLSPFEEAFQKTLLQQSSMAAQGIQVENLTMIRTRFILDWYGQNAALFPHRLFEHHQQLLRSGLFEAYDRWLFQSAVEKDKYELWCKANPETVAAFEKLQKNRVFKVPAGQYYGRKS